MIRTELLDKLNTVSPGLAKNNLIPVLTHIWFTGTHVMTFNDQIAVSIPCKTQFKGAVPGDTLLNLLKNSRAKEVEFNLNGNEMQVKAASSTFKLGFLPPDAFLHEMPALSNTPFPIDGKAFVDAVNICLHSVTFDTSVPDYLGITLIPGEKHLLVYAADGQTISHVKLNTKDKLPLTKRIVLSATFCAQVSTIAKGAKALKLEIHNDYSLLANDKGVVLFGRLIDVEQPIDFPSIVKKHLGEVNKFIEVPSKLRLILERAVVITEHATDKGITYVGSRNGRLRFASKSGRGEVHDSVQVEDQPEVSFSIDCKHVKVGYDKFKEMAVTQNCFIMREANALYMIGTL